MIFQTVVFYAFAALLLFAALRVITTRNPVHAALWLVFSFFTAAGVWLLLQAEFLAIALIVVYVGAVMVLFLFVVMMLDIQIDRLRASFWRHLPLAAAIGVAIALQLWLVLSNWHWQQLLAPPRAAAAPNTQALGELAFTEYLLPLQIAGAILLVAMVAAIALTHRRRGDALRQRPGEQVRTRARERVRLVSVPVARAPSPAKTPEA